MLLFPRLILLAAIGLGLTMAGGIGLQIYLGNPLLVVPPFFLLLGLGLLTYSRSPQITSVRRLKSVMDAFAEEEILREELRRETLRTPAPSSPTRGPRKRIPLAK
jgi:hypothetical protein